MIISARKGEVTTITVTCGSEKRFYFLFDLRVLGLFVPSSRLEG